MASAPSWRLLIYRLPKEPSRHRVAVWRELRRAGAVALQQATWAAPRGELFDAAVARAVGLWLVDRRAGLVAGLLALAMACARVYAGAHYPGDVLGGLLVGSLVAAAGWIPARRLIVPVAERGLSSVRELVQTRRT